MAPSVVRGFRRIPISVRSDIACEKRVRTFSTSIFLACESSVGMFGPDGGSPTMVSVQSTVFLPSGAVDHDNVSETAIFRH